MLTKILGFGSRALSGSARLLKRAQTFLEQQLEQRSAALHGMPMDSVSIKHEETALRFAAVYACVRAISEAKGSLPIEVFEKKSNGRDSKLVDHPVTRLLSVEPNEDMTPMTFGEVRTSHTLLWGNSYTALDFDRGEVSRATPVQPCDAQPFRGDDGKLRYTIRDSSGTQTLQRDEVLHIPAFTLNGITGKSVIRNYASHAVGRAMAADQFVGNFFANQARPSLVFSFDGELSDEAYARLKGDISQQTSGSKVWSPLLLESSGKVSTYSMPLAEAQLLESRQYESKQIAGCFFKCPPHVIGHMDDVKDLDAMDRYFVKHTLTPWLIRDEQEFNRKLFSDRQRGKLYVKYNPDALMRGDIKNRYEAHKIALFAGWATINEIRALEELPPVDGGDELPRPAAIWGKQDKPLAPKDESRSHLVDTRFFKLAAQTIGGLIHREHVALANAAKKPAEFERKVGEFYDRHRGLVEEKLDVISKSTEPIVELIERHRNQIIEIGRGNKDNLAESIEACTRHWDGDAIELAETLLEVHAEGSKDLTL